MPIAESAHKNPPQKAFDELLELYNQGHLRLATDRAQNLTKAFPNSSILWNILGVVNLGAGRYEQAEAGFRKATHLNSQYIAALNNLGVALQKLGKFEDSISTLTKVVNLKPEYAEAFNNLGISLKEAGRLNLSVEAFESAIKIRKNYAEAFNNLGIAFRLKRDFLASSKALKTALEIKPNFAEAFNNLGRTFQEKGELEEAIKVFRKALKINPKLFQAFNDLGVAYHAKHDLDQALASYEEAIRLNPDYAEAYSNMGFALIENGKFDKALSILEKSLEIKPDLPSAYNNIGYLFRTKGNLEEAVFYFDKAIEIDPEYSDGLYNRSLMHLKSSEWVEGWRGFESRWKVATGTFKPLISAKPLWEGGFVERLLIWSEQGVGDEVMFSSCFNELESYCDQLIVSCDKRLLSLFERSFNNSIRFVDKDVDVDESLYDAQAPAGTAFGFLRQEDQSFLDNKKPYLTSDSQVRNILRGRLNEMGPGAKIVGISWKTSALKDAVKRSLDLSELVKEIPNDFLLVNLQYGDVKEELAELQDSMGRSILQLDDVDNFKDLDGFSSLIKACDKVISIDNSTVHFAGALGVECHVLLPFSHISDWRWGLNGVPQSYCYDKTYLHWQEEPNNWSGCLRSLKSYLMGTE